MNILRAIYSLYRPRYATTLAAALQERHYHLGRYLAWYWTTQDFSPSKQADTPLARRGRQVQWGLRGGIGAQILIGIFVFVYSLRHQTAGGWQFGLALTVSAPVIWAHLLVVIVALWWLAHPKKLGRAIVCNILERQVRKLRAKHNFRIAAVVGSVGKTSTKAALAQTLHAGWRVRWQQGNYNDRVTVPLIFFGQPEPNITNAFAWVRIFMSNARQLRRPYPYDVVVIELGPDGPGQMQAFAYLKPELVVLTAITPEHMAFFGTLDNVAAEELTALSFAGKVLINQDDVPPIYLPKKGKTYGLETTAAYHPERLETHGLGHQTMTLTLHKQAHDMQITLLGQQGAKVALAAAAAADMLGLAPEKIIEGLQSIQPFPGRMQILPGLEGSTLIDDTYNASPIAVTAALDVLYAASTPQRIAILGSMNELGDFSPEAHKQVGAYCDPKKLDMVVTIGKEARSYLKPAAISRGCSVKSFTDPYKAGRYVRKLLQPSAIVLAKGSQNGVFAEEALKQLLADPADAAKLVRQSDAWLHTKHRQFPR